MNISEIIAELQKIMDEHGDCEVIINGCYGSTGWIDSISYEESHAYGFLSGKGVVLGSDICSG